MYFEEDDNLTDFYCGEILRLRVKENIDKGYLFAILKSKYFKHYLDIETPGGSTLRHSKLISLNFKVPYPEDRKDDIKYLSLIVQNIMNKEKLLKSKKITINDIFENELLCNRIKDSSINDYPKSNFIKKINRFDTGLYSKRY